MSDENIRCILARKGITVFELAKWLKVTPSRAKKWIDSELTQEQRAQIINAIDIINLSATRK